LWAAPVAWWVINSQITIIDAPYSPLYPGHILAAILVILGCYEYLKMLGHSFPRNAFWLIYVWLGLQMVSYFHPEKMLDAQYDYFLLLVLVAAEGMIWGKTSKRWKRASLLFSGSFFISISAYSLMNFYGPTFQSFFPNTGRSEMLSQLGIIVVLASIFFCDSAAYFAGNFWGKHHFSSISPKKTIEGSIAGLITSVVISTIGWHFLSDKHILIGIFMGVIIGVFAQLGDLVVSLMKRYYHVKDASNIIPGHGGILDRFDSLFFTAPVLNLYFILADKLSG